MILNKYAALVKRGHLCQVVDVEDSGMWLATNAAIYRATNLPLLHGNDQVRTVLNISESAWEKIVLKERNGEKLESTMGLDLTEYSQTDKSTKPLKLAVFYEGGYYTGLECEDGELIFYDRSLTAPILDDLQSDYGQIVARTNRHGIRYLVVLNGFEVVAAIMPMKVLTEDFLADLSEFHAKCTVQHIQNNATIDLTEDEEPEEPEEPEEGEKA